MIIRKVDSLNDWNWGRGRGDYARDEQAIDQNVRSRILMWIGDCFFAQKEGIDWVSRLDVGQKDEAVNEVTAMILSSDGVVGLNGAPVVEFDPATRNLHIDFNMITIFSESFLSVINQVLGATV